MCQFLSVKYVSSASGPYFSCEKGFWRSQVIVLIYFLSIALISAACQCALFDRLKKKVYSLLIYVFVLVTVSGVPDSSLTIIFD